MANDRITVSFNFPPEIILSIAEHLDPASKLRFAKITKSQYSLFKHDPDNLGLKSLYDEANEFIKDLFVDVANGEVSKAREALYLFPRLVNYKATIHQIERYHFFDRTPYQIALANEDEYMLQMMDFLFSSILVHGKEEKEKQFKEQFPNGLIKENWDRNTAIELFDKLFLAIKLDQQIHLSNLNIMSHDTRKALNAFYNYITAAQTMKLTTGLIFDMEFYLYTAHKYKEDLMFLTTSRSIFYKIKVHGYLQRLLPTGYQKPYGYGLSVLVENEVLTLRTFIENPLLPLENYIDDEDAERYLSLGQDYYINVVGQEDSSCPSIWATGQEITVLEKLITSNKQILNSLLEKYEEKNHCTIF